MDEHHDPYAAPAARVEDSAPLDRQTRLGNVSLLLAGFSVLCVLGYFALAALSLTRAKSPDEAVLGSGFVMALMLIPVSIGASLIGAGLGTAGLFRKQRRRATAVVGTLVNLAILFAYGFLLVIAGTIAFSIVD